MFDISSLNCVAVWFVGIVVFVAIVIYALWLLKVEVSDNTHKRR